MTYRIIAYDSPTDTVGHVVYDPTMNKLVSDGKLTLKSNEVDDLQLTVNQSNYLFGNVKAFQTHIEVYSDHDELIFRGRCLDFTKEMKDNGQFIQSFVFESIENYLKDSTQYYRKVQDTDPVTFFRQLIRTHNEQVPDYKKFVVGKADVTNSSDNVYRYIDYVDTRTTIMDKLVRRLGGYLRVRYENGQNIVDYMVNPGVDHSTGIPLQISKNMMSENWHIDPTGIITRLMPLGATWGDNDPDMSSNAALPRTTIESVNDGKMFIDIPQLQAEFGTINGSVVWDDVHDPQTLYNKAQAWIKAQATAKETFTVNALELPNLDKFDVHSRYLLINQNVSEQKVLRVTQKVINFTDLYKSELTFGDKNVTLSQFQLDQQNSRKSINFLNSRISSLGGQLSTLSEENKTLSTTVGNQQKVINSTKSDVNNADLKAINGKLDNLSEGLTDIQAQINANNWVTTTALDDYKASQKLLTDGLDQRLAVLEGGRG